MKLDLVLIDQARRLVTGANCHQAGELIFAYQQSVVLHNHRWGRHTNYQKDCERELREWVLSQLAAQRQRAA